MPTKKLFADDRYLKECESIVINVTPTDDSAGLDLILDQTVFFPTGGGQSCDLGTINGLEVIDVFEKSGEIHHIVEFPKDLDSLTCVEPPKFPINGDRVFCVINWERRFLNMQRHCGEHILSGIFDSECGGVNRGFHMGNDYMTIDISLEKKPEITDITPEMLAKIERLANEVIWQNLPVVVRHFDTKEEAEHLPLRKPLSIESDISIVCVGDIKNPSDCVACCGTHPLSAGSVGLIKIYKMESNKGMFRIYFDSGKNAFEHCVFKHDTISKLCKKYSANEDTLLEKIDIQDTKNQAVKNELFSEKKLVHALLFDKFKQLATNSLQSSIFVSELIHYISRADFEALNKLLMEFASSQDNSGKFNELFFVIYYEHELDLYLLSPGNLDCNFFKQTLLNFGAKGGGNAHFAGFKFESENALHEAIVYLKKERGQL